MKLRSEHSLFAFSREIPVLNKLNQKSAILKHSKGKIMQWCMKLIGANSIVERES